MRTIPGLSIDTKTITDRLAKASVGEVVPYSELTLLIGRDVQHEARPTLSSALRRLGNEGIVFGCVRGLGVKRLTDAEIVGVGPATLSKIRRAARRAQTKLAAVADFDALPRAAQTTHNMSLSVLGVLSHLTKGSTVRLLEGRIEQAQAALPLAKTLDALRSGDA